MERVHIVDFLEILRVQKGFRSCSLSICDMALEGSLAFALYYYNGCDELIPRIEL